MTRMDRDYWITMPFRIMLFFLIFLPWIIGDYLLDTFEINMFDKGHFELMGIALNKNFFSRFCSGGCFILISYFIGLLIIIKISDKLEDWRSKIKKRMEEDEFDPYGKLFENNSK